MRLSEAIKLGSLLGPHLKDGRLVGPGNASCAMGAALLALGVDTVEAQTIDLFHQGNLQKTMLVQGNLNDLLHRYFPGLQRPVGDALLPALHSCIVPRSLFSYLWQMNDRTWLTRQQIADWLVNTGLDCDSVDIQQQEQHEHEAIPVTA